MIEWRAMPPCRACGACWTIARARADVDEIHAFVLPRIEAARRRYVQGVVGSPRQLYNAARSAQLWGELREALVADVLDAYSFHDPCKRTLHMRLVDTESGG